MCSNSKAERVPTGHAAVVPERVDGGGRRYCYSSLLVLAVALVTCSCATWGGRAIKDKRCAFMGLTSFSSFSQSPGGSNNETVLLSPVISAPIEWDELVVSWNVAVRRSPQGGSTRPLSPSRYPILHDGLVVGRPGAVPARKRAAAARPGRRCQDGHTHPEQRHPQGAAPDHGGRSRGQAPAQVPRALVLQQRRARPHLGAEPRRLGQGPGRAGAAPGRI